MRDVGEPESVMFGSMNVCSNAGEEDAVMARSVRNAPQFDLAGKPAATAALELRRLVKYRHENAGGADTYAGGRSFDHRRG